MKNTWAFSAQFGGVFILIFLLFLGTGCQKKEEPSQAKDDPKEITLTFPNTPWPPDAISYLAQEKGFFEKQGVKVRLLSSDGYEEMFAQFESGELDILTATLLDAIHYRANTGVGKVIYVQDISTGADAVVTLSPEINTMADLVNKRVGVERGTVGEFFLNILLDRQGLTLKDLQMVDVASENILDHLKEGVIEVGVCYEPCPTEVVKAGGWIVADSSKEKNSIVDVYLAKEGHIQAHKDAYLKALTAIAEAGEYFNAHPEESAAIMKGILKMSEEEILAAFQGIRIPNFSENKTAFNRTFGFTSLYNLAQLAGQYLEKQGLLEETFEPNQLIHPELVEAMSYFFYQP